MADNFDYKKYLQDNKLGPYSKAMKETAETKKPLTSTKTNIKKPVPGKGKNSLYEYKINSPSSNWWAKANKQLDLGFDDDIESYINSYDEQWQKEFAEEVMDIDAENYKDYKAQVKDIYDSIYPS